MSRETAAPCRHAGAPPADLVRRVIELVSGLSSDHKYLASQGLTADEYRLALPSAIETLRGSLAASNSARRKFLTSIFQAMTDRALIAGFEMPQYGDDTVYRLTIEQFGDVAIIQKGCPDGAHSSVRWSVPAWARESYLWWLCPSLAHEPGEHIVSGINRLRQRFFSETPGVLDRIIFHNELCGTAQRPCPKNDRALLLDDVSIPPPCIYVMPDRSADKAEWNWDGRLRRRFPEVLLRLFGIDDAAYVGYVGFQRRGDATRTTVTSRFGTGRSTVFRQ